MKMTIPALQDLMDSSTRGAKYSNKVHYIKFAIGSRSITNLFFVIFNRILIKFYLLTKYYTFLKIKAH